MRTNLKRMFLATLDIGRFDRCGSGQINHAMRCRISIFGKEEFGSGKKKVTSSPIFEPHGLFGQPSFEVGVVAWVNDLSVRVDVGWSGHGMIRGRGRGRIRERVCL
mmetsp:Transcript_9323/g.17559  ORF Transcript_9323/g.17559 Transcript_9323/m.17559 type:complete len:106 (+) Transcript_9323:1237-1554(+)